MTEGAGWMMDLDRRPWPTTGVIAVWLASRTLFVLIYAGVVPAPVGGVFTDVQLYQRWSDELLDRRIPGTDPMWQYPPGAAALFTVVRLLAGGSVDGYVTVFFAGALAADLLVLATLLRLARGDGLPLGAWVWAAVVPLLNLLTYARYDIFVTAIAVVALAATRRRPVLAGAAVAVGALVKVWPALLLVATRPGRGLRRTAAGFGTAALVLGLAATLAFTGAWSGFTGNQADRGLQIESVAATPLVLGQLWDESIEVGYVYGALEFNAAYVGPATVVLPVLTVLGLSGAGLWWLVRGRRVAWSAAVGFDLALLTVLVSVVTSRVFSPQYLLWLIGLAAVALTRRDSTQRASSALIVLATVLTSALFPWFYHQVSTDPAWPGTILLVVRNMLVVTALGVGLARFLSAARP